MIKTLIRTEIKIELHLHNITIQKAKGENIELPQAIATFIIYVRIGPNLFKIRWFL